MNFIAPWKEIRFRFNSPTFWRINLLATLNGMFFASLAVSIAGVLHFFISEATGTGTGNLSLPQVFIVSLIFLLVYGGIGFEFVIIPALILFIPVCLCNLFLNTNLWSTIVYYILFILLLMASFSGFYPWNPRETAFNVAVSICCGTVLGYNLWKHCFLYYTDLNDDDRELLPIIPSWEICRPIVNVFKIILVMFLIVGVGLLSIVIRN